MNTPAVLPEAKVILFRFLGPQPTKDPTSYQYLDLIEIPYTTFLTVTWDRNIGTYCGLYCFPKEASTATDSGQGVSLHILSRVSINMITV